MIFAERTCVCIAPSLLNNTYLRWLWKQPFERFYFKDNIYYIKIGEKIIFLISLDFKSIQIHIKVSSQHSKGSCNDSWKILKIKPTYFEKFHCKIMQSKQKNIHHLLKKGITNQKNVKILDNSLILLQIFSFTKW